MTSSETSRVSRRNFIKAAGLGAASTAIGATTLSAVQAQEEAWDAEVDVIAVGSGGAALAGACGAIDNGATVLVLEKADFVGGTTSKSGGGSWVPNSHHMQAAGLPDDRDTFLRYCARVSFPELYNDQSPTYGLMPNNLKLLETFYDNAARVFKKLDESGAHPTTMAMSWDNQPGADYHGQIEENGQIRGRQTSPRDEDGNEGFGFHMIMHMQAYVEERGATVLTEHRVTRILRDETGRVIGVEAETPEGNKRFRALKGVIFGSGGFTQNPEMRANYLRTPIMGGCAVPANEGDLILMASEVGAKFGNLNEAWNQQVVLEEVLEFSSVASGVFFLGGDSSIAVNRFGKRMYDEKYVYPERSRSHQVYDQWSGSYPNLYQIFIFDHQAREFGGMLVPTLDTDVSSTTTVADTLEELAEKVQARFDALSDRIGTYKLDPAFLDNLKETIARYNGFAETGVDTDFHRGEAPADAFFHSAANKRDYPNPYMAPISETGPYYAVLLGAGALDTKGGPVFNENGQVLDIHDQPIAGFYVAGNAGASPSGKSYLGGGGTLGLGVTFGYMAGEHAATQA
jgi:3-oxosteroid 1-dehydrogenase